MTIMLQMDAARHAVGWLLLARRDEMAVRSRVALPRQILAWRSATA
ncbi:hypothetical protein JNA64_08805 [Pseudomonas stutzeri]|nr:hypothetical protein [Stutzerimonas stutzeri]MCI0917262.1 hypothetical protein [Stutzerimonas stutzeri]